MRKRYQAPAIASSEITSESTYLKKTPVAYRLITRSQSKPALQAFIRANRKHR